MLHFPLFRSPTRAGTEFSLENPVPASRLFGYTEQERQNSIDKEGWTRRRPAKMIGKK